jgi:hypothetical protein
VLNGVELAAPKEPALDDRCSTARALKGSSAYGVATVEEFDHKEE